MRALKFRSWDGSKMIQVGWDTVSQQGYYSPMEFFEYGYEGFKEVMQFTGLKDSKGTDIYEGDLLMYVATNRSSMEVKFINGCFVGEGPFNTCTLNSYFSAIDFESIEITGNIYENHDLIPNEPT